MMSVVEWDENKRQSNIAKHGFDFLDAEEILFGLHVRISSHKQTQEQRWLAIGKINDRFATVVYAMRHTARQEIYRIISIRSARQNERRKYQALYGG